MITAVGRIRGQSAFWNDSFFELSNNIAFFDGHGRVNYLGLVINEDIGFCFSIDDSAAVMCHCFIWWVCLRCTLEASYSLPHVFPVVVSHGVFKYSFPAIGLGVNDCLFCFSASFNPFLVVGINCTAVSVTCTNLCSYVMCYPRFGFSSRLSFPY